MADAANSKKAFCPTFNVDVEFKLVEELSDLTYELNKKAQELANARNEAKRLSEDVRQYAAAYRDNVLSNMNDARKFIDRMEKLTASDYWPYPTYSELLFNV